MDPRFLELTREEILADVIAHQFADDPKAASEIEDEDFDPEKVAEQIGARALDDWENLE